MSLFIAYADESHDDEKFCLSAMVVRHRDWHDALKLAKAHRKFLKDTYGVKLRGELHSRELVKGKGRSFATRILSRWERSQIFLSMLRTVAAMPRVLLFNIVLDKAGHRDAHLTAWDRLFNRLERAARGYDELERKTRKDLCADLWFQPNDTLHREIENRPMAYAARFMVVADEGRETEITRALRRMHVFNQIPSNRGAWGPGQVTRNIPIERCIEDPFFRRSEDSYFIQLMDAVAFALLKREVPPTPNVKTYGIDKMFDAELAGVCVRKASRFDRLGIVRK